MNKYLRTCTKDQRFENNNKYKNYTRNQFKTLKRI